MTAPVASAAGLMGAALPAGSAFHSGPNSGTSAALGLSETGLVGGVGEGVEEVIVLVVEVVRIRYH